MTADLFAGDFASQPLVFAHLWDASGTDYDADQIEVICNQDPAKRLRHYFSEADARAVEDGMGLATTCVIVFAGAGLDFGTQGTEKLRFLGSFPSLRPR